MFSTLLEPADGKSVVLEPSASSSVYFEWQTPSVEETGTALYQIAFDKVDGDFSKPVYVMCANNNGFGNYVSVTHKQLNQIAGNGRHKNRLIRVHSSGLYSLQKVCRA